MRPWSQNRLRNITLHQTTKLKQRCGQRWRNSHDESHVRSLLRPRSARRRATQKMTVEIDHSARLNTSADHCYNLISTNANYPQAFGGGSDLSSTSGPGVHPNWDTTRDEVEGAAVTATRPDVGCLLTQNDEAGSPAYVWKKTDRKPSP